MCSHLCDYLICVCLTLTFSDYMELETDPDHDPSPFPTLWSHNEFYELESIINLIRIRTGIRIVNVSYGHCNVNTRHAIINKHSTQKHNKCQKVSPLSIRQLMPARPACCVLRPRRQRLASHTALYYFNDFSAPLCPYQHQPRNSTVLATIRFHWHCAYIYNSIRPLATSDSDSSSSCSSSSCSLILSVYPCRKYYNFLPKCVTH